MLNNEQRQQLQQLIFTIMDTMQRTLRDVFDTMGTTPTTNKRPGEPLDGIQTPTATWAIVPNPRSSKYAHLFGMEPLMPVTESKDDEKETEEKDKDKENSKETKECKEKEKPRPRKEPPKPDLVPPAPIIPPALIALASQQKGGALTVPQSIEQATAMIKRDETDVITSSMVELKRDALTHIGKWRSNILRRMGDITIKNGGNGGNVVSQGPQHAPGNASRRGGGAAGRGRPARPIGGGKFFLCGDPLQVSVSNFFWLFIHYHLAASPPRLTVLVYTCHFISYLWGSFLASMSRQAVSCGPPLFDNWMYVIANMSKKV